MVNNHFTLHIRLTNVCNASCDYCSSASSSSSEKMSVLDFKKSCDYILKILKLNLNTNKKHLSIQYVGGEILTYPMGDLKECVEYARSLFKPHFLDLNDGVQTNLLSSPKKINFLKSLFGKNIGSSIENFTDKRSFKGRADLYKKLLNKNIKGNFDQHPSVVSVLDKDTIVFADKEYERAVKNGYSLTFNPAFDGRNEIDELSMDDLTVNFLNIFEKWFMKEDVIIEPLFSLLSKRFHRTQMNIESFKNYSGCPFQHNCHELSLNLESNGDLYLCYEMADSNNYKLGNAIDMDFNYENYNIIKNRSKNLPSECRSCEYILECQGGCMSKSIESTGNIYGLTLYCDTWKSLFSKIDIEMKKHKPVDINNWLSKLESGSN